MKDTVTNRLSRRAQALATGIEELLRKHSCLRYWNHRGGEVVILAGDYLWNPLQPPGQQLQSKLTDDHEKYVEIMKVLLEGSERLRKFVEFDREISKGIEQRGDSWEGDLAKIEANAKASLLGQIELLNGLYDSTADESLIVPDTNALLYNPDLESWQFTDYNPFTLVLTPSVVTELDQQKVNHRVETVRQKAESLIRRIKEYRRRGNILEGVTLVNGKSKIRALPLEPKFEHTLPWLDATNNDDRLVASVLEVMREHCRSDVVLATRDLNLQNKADFAGFPYVEPPDP